GRVALGTPGASSAPVGQTVVESGAYHASAVTGLRVGAVAPGRVGGARGHPVAARLDGQCAFFTPASPRNPAPGKLFRPVSRACPGGVFALKAGSCKRTFNDLTDTLLHQSKRPLSYWILAIF